MPSAVYLFPAERPSRVSILKTLGDSLKTETYHHVIPLQTLRAYWNGMNDETLISFMQSLVKKHFSYRKLSGVDDADRITSDGGDVFDYTGLYNALSGRNINNSAIICVQAIFAWLPGNLVIGPKNRAQDPGDGFDSYIARLLQESRREGLMKLHDLMNLLDYSDRTRNIIYDIAKEPVTQDDNAWKYVTVEGGASAWVIKK